MEVPEEEEKFQYSDVEDFSMRCSSVPLINITDVKHFLDKNILSTKYVFVNYI